MFLMKYDDNNKFKIVNQFKKKNFFIYFVIHLLKKREKYLISTHCDLVKYVIYFNRSPCKLLRQRNKKKMPTLLICYTLKYKIIEITKYIIATK